MVKALNLEKTLRSFTLDKLRAFNVIINNSNPTIESGELGIALGGGTVDTKLGGVVSSLVRTKVDNMPLVTTVTKTKNRQSGQLNSRKNYTASSARTKST